MFCIALAVAVNARLFTTSGLGPGGTVAPTAALGSRFVEAGERGEALRASRNGPGRPPRGVAAFRAPRRPAPEPPPAREAAGGYVLSNFYSNFWLHL